MFRKAYLIPKKSKFSRIVVLVNKMMGRIFSLLLAFHGWECILTFLALEALALQLRFKGKSGNYFVFRKSSIKGILLKVKVAAVFRSYLTK